MKKEKMSLKKIKTALSYWNKKLQESQELPDISEEEFMDVPKGQLDEEDLPPNDLMEADLFSSRNYAPNTVGALIEVLRRDCDMNDILLPRVSPGKKEHMIFDIYSKAGRCVIDLVPGRIDDPKEI